jgi:hypothetical protein
MLDPVAVLIAPYDPETAYLLKLVDRRSPGSLLAATPLPDDIGPERRAEIEAEAATIPIDDAIALALDTLDRYYPRSGS